jgi:hypothetical protein
MENALNVETSGAIKILNKITLKSLQSSVGGFVQPLTLAPDFIMWCNEEGKLLNLPHNPYAQFFWDAKHGSNIDYIVGDVVFTGGNDEEGGLLSLPIKRVAEVGTAIKSVNKIVKPLVRIHTVDYMEDFAYETWVEQNNAEEWCGD